MSVILVFRKPVAEIEYCITRLDNGVIHDLVWPNDAEMEEAFLAIGRTVVTGDAAANVEEQVHTCLFFLSKYYHFYNQKNRCHLIYYQHDENLYLPS